jgi:hypothetical protein
MASVLAVKPPVYFLLIFACWSSLAFLGVTARVPFLVMPDEEEDLLVPGFEADFLRSPWAMVSAFNHSFREEIITANWMGKMADWFVKCMEQFMNSACTDTGFLFYWGNQSLGMQVVSLALRAGRTAEHLKSPTASKLHVLQQNYVKYIRKFI